VHLNTWSQRTRLWSGAACVFCGLLPRVAAPLDAERRVTQYVHDSWTARQGAPTGTITAITQTRDGYLWLATSSDGLVRFDGVRFARVAELTALFPLPTTEVRSLLTARDGTLWVGTSYGLARRVDGRWERVDEGRSHAVDDLAEASDGTIVFARDRIGFGVVRNGQVTVHQTSETGNRCIALTDDGTVWLGNDSTLRPFSLGGTARPPMLNVRVNALYVDHGGRLWVATRAGVYRFAKARLDAGPSARDSLPDPTVNRILQDRDGSIWIATRSEGLLRLSRDRRASFTKQAGLTDDNATALYEDQDGSLWVATVGGLDRFRDSAFVPLGMSEGLPNNNAVSVLTTRDGALWTFTDGSGLNRIDPDGRLRTYTTRDGLATNFGGPLYEARDGSLWVGHDHGLTHVSRGVAHAFRDPSIANGYIAAITEDDEGLLLYIMGLGLQRFSHGRIEPYRLRDGSALTVRMPLAMYHARDGALWLATVDGLIAVKNGVARDVWRVPRSAVVTSLIEDSGGVLWVGTWHGLLRVERGQVTTYGLAQGLFDPKIHTVLDDRHGYLWMGCPRGIFRVFKRELEDVAAGRLARVTSDAFGSADGMRTPETTAAAPPTGCVTRDGRLWFTSKQGLIAVDPARLKRNSVPPPVLIETILADGVALPASSQVSLPAGALQIEIQYDAPSLLIPERVRFRYRLDGYDDAWVDAGARRTAFYTRLPPGRHVFHVTACNNDGVWNPGGAALALEVAPRWYQTWPFYVLAVVGVAGVVSAAHHVRVRRIQVRERALEQRVLERTAALRQEILERERAQTALEESEERYELAIRGANEGIWDWDLVSDRMYLSPLWKSILGYSDHEIESRTEEWFSRIHPEDVERVRAKLLGYRGSQASHYTDEFRVRHRDGGFRWVLSRGFAVRDAEGRCQRVVGAMSDVTDRRAFDPLTGLPNRARFMEYLAELFASSRAEPHRCFAVLFLDLDRFKLVNDSLGHLAGDQLLVAIAKRFEICLRPGDIVARFPGDEFVILVRDLRQPNEVLAIADRIQREMTYPVLVGDSEAFASVTIGIAVSSERYTQPEEMVRDADTAMHAAKERGRSQHEVFHDRMRAQVVTTLELENALRRGIDRDELIVHYQPIISLSTGSIEGFEALVRWNHPTRGLVLPNEFISLAEEARLIAPLGRWVRREACRQLRTWRAAVPAADGISMSVNVSPREFAEPDLAREIRGLLRETHVPPRRLRIEITETTLMAGDYRVAATLERLQALQIPLDIDDFGTGYSSLSYLQQLPVAALKIDRTFTQKLGPRGENLAFIQTMVSLARSLGIPVVAEGVETEEQLALVRQAGCDRAQGFFIARPLDAEHAVALIGTVFPLPH
jgi:diguanylate cyclase (GGDEF)-like protein/PAS domain S-box-containing protein